MPTLVGSIDTPKSLLNRQLDKILRSVFFPGGAVQKARHRHTVDKESFASH
jgi:hypothetical protein